MIQTDPTPLDTPFSDRPSEEQTAGSPQPQTNTAVRFASTVEEISPTPAAMAVSNTDPNQPDSIAEVMSDQIRELSTSLQNVDLQGRRLSRFAFEPYSLPASRVRTD